MALLTRAEQRTSTANGALVAAPKFGRRRASRKAAIFSKTTQVAYAEQEGFLMFGAFSLEARPRQALLRTGR